MATYSKHIRIQYTLLVLLFLICFFGSFLLGKYPIDPVTLVKALLSRVFDLPKDWPNQVETVLFHIRLPRVIMGAIIGGGLSCAGAAYQGIFQNPMVSPDLLGASNGAAFGAALGLFFRDQLQGHLCQCFYFRFVCSIHCFFNQSKGEVQCNTGAYTWLELWWGPYLMRGVSLFKVGCRSNGYSACHHLLADGKSGFHTSTRRIFCRPRYINQHDTHDALALENQYSYHGVTMKQEPWV